MTKLFIFCLLFTLINCSSSKRASERDGADVSISPEAVPFPHPEGWELPEVHGGWVNRKGKEPCFRCHALNPSTSTNESPKACRSCHALYPHQENWKEREVHGSHVRSQGTQTCETSCHGGSELQGGLSHIRCESCHETFPHRGNWREEHGAAVVRLGKDTCRSCHGQDLHGGTSGVSCTQCHPAYPHEDGWRERQLHGASVLSRNSAGECMSCHTIDGDGGGSGIPCASCHHHPADGSWIPYVGGHGQKVQETFQKSTERCEICHGEDLRQNILGKNCYSCHNYPHAKDLQWMTANTNNPGNLNNHATAFLAGDRSENTSPCVMCHIKLRGGAANRLASDCTSCHNGNYPHIRFVDFRNPNAEDTWIYRSPSLRWNQTHSFYALFQSYLADKHHSGTNLCKTCHGQDLGGNGVEAKQCARCHTPGVISHDFVHWRNPDSHGINSLLVHNAAPGVRTPDNCLSSGCHQSIFRRPPANVCNPYVGQVLATGQPQIPQNALDRCAGCHDMPASGCPPDGCASRPGLPKGQCF